MHNPYGLLRSPWNTNPVPYIMRSAKTYGVKNGGWTTPDCITFAQVRMLAQVNTNIRRLQRARSGPLELTRCAVLMPPPRARAAPASGLFLCLPTRPFPPHDLLPSSRPSIPRLTPLASPPHAPPSPASRPSLPFLPPRPPPRHGWVTSSPPSTVNSTAPSTS